MVSPKESGGGRSLVGKIGSALGFGSGGSKGGGKGGKMAKRASSHASLRGGGGKDAKAREAAKKAAKVEARKRAKSRAKEEWRDAAKANAKAQWSDEKAKPAPAVPPKPGARKKSAPAVPSKPWEAAAESPAAAGGGGGGGGGGDGGGRSKRATLTDRISGLFARAKTTGGGEGSSPTASSIGAPTLVTSSNKRTDLIPIGQAQAQQGGKEDELLQQGSFGGLGNADGFVEVNAERRQSGVEELADAFEGHTWADGQESPKKRR